jgi:hypothetical protein
VDEKLNMWQFFVAVAMTNIAILAAATSWNADLIAFPPQ